MTLGGSPKQEGSLWDFLTDTGQEAKKTPFSKLPRVFRKGR